jgi:hypothetical protein
VRGEQQQSTGRRVEHARQRIRIGAFGPRREVLLEGHGPVMPQAGSALRRFRADAGADARVRRARRRDDARARTVCPPVRRDHLRSNATARGRAGRRAPGNREKE